MEQCTWIEAPISLQQMGRLGAHIGHLEACLRHGLIAQPRHLLSVMDAVESVARPKLSKKISEKYGPDTLGMPSTKAVVLAVGGSVVAGGAFLCCRPAKQPNPPLAPATACWESNALTLLIDLAGAVAAVAAVAAVVLLSYLHLWLCVCFHSHPVPRKLS